MMKYRNILEDYCIYSLGTIYARLTLTKSRWGLLGDSPPHLALNMWQGRDSFRTQATSYLGYGQPSQGRVWRVYTAV